MKYKQDKIVRPILNFTKIEIKQYIDEQGVPCRKDKSNLDLKYTRNRIRHELIPYLVEKYNPNIVETLAVSHRTMGDDYDFIHSFSKHIYKDLIKKESESDSIELDNFLDLFPTLQREIIRIIFKDFEIEMRDVSFLDLSELIRVMKEGKGGSKRTIKGLRFEKKSGSMVVSKVKY
jgi:tRNA(Ile)-lysidine synthase